MLEAYAEKPQIAPAERLAGVHRATVYRWMADPEFVTAIRAAAQEFFRRDRARVDAEEEAERKQWRQERERARRMMRCANLATARAAKRR